jgi:hypothetical protein
MATLKTKLNSLTVELVHRDNTDEICKFITFGESKQESVQLLEESNNLIVPVMEYIKACKSILLNHRVR